MSTSFDIMTEKNSGVSIRFKSCLSPDDKKVVSEVEKLEIRLDCLNNILNEVTDLTLIDSYIYEINAINLRYKYYLDLCKERELVADGYEFS